LKPHMLPPLFFDFLITGIVLGLIYALMTTGLTLIYGVMRLSNFAHGEYYMIGGYALLFSTLALGTPSIINLPFAMIGGLLVGFAIERLVIRDTYTKVMVRPFEYAMLGTMASAILLQNLAKEVFGPFVRSAPAFVPGSIEILQVTLSLNRVVAMAVSLVTLLLLYLFIMKTRTGRAWRAVAQNRTGAVISGISIGRANFLAYGVGAALAGLSGALLTPIYGVWPNIGWGPLVLSFVIMVLGGVGSYKGALIGALIVGLIHSFIAGYVSPPYADVAMYAVLLAVLVLKPKGMFGQAD